MLLLFGLFSVMAKAQKPFTEGIIIYKISIESLGNHTATGTYTCIIKGEQIRKELKMDNGYQDILLFDYSKNTVYSLQIRGDKKYAIQLSLGDFTSKQKKYLNFTLQDKPGNTKQIAGNNAQEAVIRYTDGSQADIYYIKDWYPQEAMTFDRFPGIKVFPLECSYTYNEGTMHFYAEKMELEPVESAAFHIPADYKMISYAEYKQAIK